MCSAVCIDYKKYRTLKERKILPAHRQTDELKSNREANVQIKRAVHVRSCRSETAFWRRTTSSLAMASSMKLWVSNRHDASTAEAAIRTRYFSHSSTVAGRRPDVSLHDIRSVCDSLNGAATMGDVFNTSHWLRPPSNSPDILRQQDSRFILFWLLSSLMYELIWNNKRKPRGGGGLEWFWMRAGGQGRPTAFDLAWWKQNSLSSATFKLPISQWDHGHRGMAGFSNCI